MPHDSPFPGSHTLGSDEGRMQHNELMDLVTKLSDRVLALETNLQQTKKVYSAAFTKVIMKVKKLEKIVKSNKARRRAKIVVSDDEDAEEDPSKQGRSMKEEIDLDAGIALVPPHVEVQNGQNLETQEGFCDGQEVSTVAQVSTASTFISTASPTRVSTTEDISTAETLVYIRRSASKDK
ncbi:hypothetical protein Tco_0257938, partial [Tanacetum coccineum]